MGNFFFVYQFYLSIFANRNDNAVFVYLFEGQDVCVYWLCIKCAKKLMIGDGMMF